MRSLDEPFTALRPHRALGRDAGRPQRDHLQPRSARAVFGRPPPHGGGRPLHLRAPEEPTASRSTARASPQVKARRDPRSAPHPLRPDGRGRPRAAPDHRARCRSSPPTRPIRRASTRPPLEPAHRLGPLRVRARCKPGERVVLKRRTDFWAEDLPITRGLYNFDEIRYDFYRDANTLFEAFKAGLYDYPLRGRSRPLGDRLRLPGRRATAASRRETLPIRVAEGHDRLRLQHAPAALRRRPRPRGARPTVRFRLGEPQPLLRRS